MCVAVWLVATHAEEQQISNYRSVVCSGLAGGQTIEALYVVVWLVATHSEEQKIRKHRSVVCSGLAGSHSRGRTTNKQL